MTRDDARRGNLREHGEPERGIYFGRDRKRPTGDGVLVLIAPEARAIRLRDTTGNTVEAFGDTTRFWLAAAPTEPSPRAGATGEAAPSPAVPAAGSRPPAAAPVPAEQAAIAPAGLIGAAAAAEEQFAARTAELALSYRLTAEAITAAGATPTPKRQTWAAAGHPGTFLYFERDIRPGRPILVTTRDGYRIHDLRTGQLIAHYASPVPMWIAAVHAPVAQTDTEIRERSKPNRALYYSASVITVTGGNTNAYGEPCEPCEPGHGYTMQSGHWSPDRDYWTVQASRDDIDPDVYPDNSPLTPAAWLAEQVTDRLGDLDHIDGRTFTSSRTAIEPGRLTGPEADKPGAVVGTHTFLGDVFAAHRLRTAPAGTRTITAAAHACGFTDTELAQAAALLGYTAPAAGRG